MMKHKVTVLLTSALLVATLAACGQDKSGTTKSADTTAKSSQTTKKSGSAKQSSTSSSAKTATSQSTAQTNKTTGNATMNFNQIKAGNFSGLVGDWSQIGTGYNRHDAHGMRYKTGGKDQLSVSKTTLTNGTGMTLHGNTLTDDAGDHPLIYQVKNNVLTVSMKDAESAINWTVTFYPKGTTSEYRDDSKASKNTKNIVVVWTSNNSYTQIFAQGAKAAHTSTSKLDTEQLQSDNFSSLVGRWKNADGKVITITNKVENKPADSNIASDKGVVVSGADHDGSPEVVVSGNVSDGYILGGIGHFNEQTFEPLAIVPRGIKATKDDDSNVNKDRLIKGGGQAGFASQAYYRE